MTTFTYKGVRFNIIAVEGFWRITVKGLALSERFITYGAAEAFAKVYIDNHEEG